MSASHRIILVGDSAVGKTSIIGQYVSKSCSSEHQATVGIDFFSKICNVDGNPVALQIWDTAGQERFHALIPSYIRNSTVAFLVFDITLRSTFDNIQKWFQTVTNVANPVMIVVGNKNDMEDERQVLTEEGEKMASQIGAQYIETCARTGANVEELFTRAAGMPLNEPETSRDEKPLLMAVTIGESQKGSEKSCFC